MERLTFRTPGGHEAVMHCRRGTNDAMVARSILEEDEYGMAGSALTGLAVDIGAHIGAWTVLALLDGDLDHVFALEPLAPNRELMLRNLEANGLADRCSLSDEALGKGRMVSIRWDFAVTRPEDIEMARMHRYIGNQRMPRGVKHKTVRAPAVTVASLIERLGPITCMKIDAEGAESALIGAKLADVGLIVGEYHSGRDKLEAHLAKTHRVNFDGEEDFGLFRAE